MEEEKKPPLPEMIPDLIPEIEGAAKEFLDAIETKAGVQEMENKAQEHLLHVMRKAGVEVYRTINGYDCILDVTEKVKVKKPKQAKE